MAKLGTDEGKYSFRRFEAMLPPPVGGALSLMPRCTSDAGVQQPLEPIWNPGGYLRAQVETVKVTAA